MTAKEQKKAAAEFAAKWLGRGYEKGECQKFWRGLLHDVFGIADPDDWLQYEIPVATGYVDAYISRTKVLIEQKGFEHGLADKAAMKQAMMYVGAMPDTMPVRYIVLSNFQEFWIYDKHAPEMKPVKVALKDLPKKLRLLSFLTELRQQVTIVRDVAAVDRKAGELVGRLYSALLKSYVGEVDDLTLESLNMLCVRLVFCAYAEDAGVFPKQDQFLNYMRRYDAESFRDRLAQFFRMLNTKEVDRDPEDIPDLLDFPYVGSGLFDDEHIRIPRFTEETRTLLLDCMCADLDWTEINPTIFGAVFESTLSTATRRKNGMHYTTVKNIHRVADPLFLWDLERELDGIAAVGNVKRRNESLLAFQKKLGSLKFLDPACGSGNFLTETYISLRRLENRAIRLRQQGQGEFDLGETICVTIDQFFGIEIDGFAVSVAQTALWIAESQMMIETEQILHRRIDFLPLKRYAHIVKGNALRMDWNALLADNEHFDYILGNPPFIGARNKSPEQAADIETVFAAWKNAGNLDYVTCWYKKAADLMRGTSTRCALVSTNSICQGESAALLWKPLFAQGAEIDFAWRTFIWDSEANEKAHVHVVIIGFHVGGTGGIPFSRSSSNVSGKYLYSGDGTIDLVNHINGYLMDGPDVFVESRRAAFFEKPLVFGSMPNDGGFLSDYDDETRNAIVGRYPDSKELFRPLVGSLEAINGIPRWCLWLKGVSPKVIRSIPPVVEAVERVRQMRLSSRREATRRLADTPHLFGEIRQPETGRYLLIPSVSSEKRRYVPMCYFDVGTIASNLALIVPEATLYDFGVLTSSVHMAWMRAVAGRLEMRYRYSAAIVYNNFPWPGCLSRVEMEGCRKGERGDLHTSTFLHGQNEIGKTAQAILDARALYPDSSLADLYDDTFMPPELRKAHQANDAAVLAAYGFNPKATESEIVARLFEMYAKLTAKEST